MYPSSALINRKINLMLLCMGFMCCVIVSRLIYLQVYCSDYFIRKGQNNFLRHETIDSLRGNILDCNGTLLATNRPITQLYWQGTGNRALSQEQITMLEAIGEIVDLNMTEGKLYESIVACERKHQKIVLASDISIAVLSKIAERYSDNKNIVIDTHCKRFYPYKHCASHALGYLGNMRIMADGKSGLEKLLNDNLSGKQGAKRNIVNSIGKKIYQEEVEKALTGDDVRITINSDLQRLCERIFPVAYTGALILMNPADGAIASLISRPNFDPNIFLDPISPDAWKQLQENNAFLNRAFDATYPSGSIFKLVTISAALEQDIITADEMWTCKGYTLFGKRKYWCSCRHGHGELSMLRAVAKSCNTLFYDIGKRIDIDVLADYAYRFGLGQKTDMLFSEKVGIVPSRAWKYNNKGERWWPGETLSVAIGQSFSLVTPIQIARMIASIFTGYLVSPRILVDEPVQTIPLDIQPDTIEFLKESMKLVVEQGTGRRVNKIKDIEIYAKTSTAQMSALEKRLLDPSYLEHGWFVGYFRYKGYDPLVIVLLVEHVGTAQTVAAIAKDFLIEYKKYMDRLAINL